MRLSKISLKNIQHKPLSSFLSILLLTFGTGIIILLLSASRQIDKQFTKNIRGIDMVVGAKGSPLQLVLSSVYQIDAPTGNISLDEFQQLRKHPMVKKATPLAYGDNYNGYRIVGSDTSYPARYDAQLASGRWWQKTTEVVVGARVAEMENLQVGDEIFSSHGVSQQMETHDHFAYKVVGVMEANGTVMDKLILTSVESVWAVHHNSEKPGDTHSEHEHSEEPKEITAGLITFKSAMGNLMLPRIVNNKTSMQAALPAIEYNRLYSLMSGGVETLQALAILIVIISAISVFISLYQSLRERRYELALMRSMGASRSKLFYIILLEGLLIALTGYLCGLIFGKIGYALLSSVINSTYQFELSWQMLTIEELLLLPAVLFIGFLAALFPALRAYRIDISKTLADA